MKSQKPIQKIKWEKFIDFEALVAEGISKEAEFAAQKQYTNPFTYRWVYWLAERLEAVFLEWCKTHSSPELQALLAHPGNKTVKLGNSRLYYGYTENNVYARKRMEEMTLFAETENGLIGFCPMLNQWKVIGAGSGVTDQEIGERFMAGDPNPSFMKQSWGRDFFKAVEDYCIDRKPGRLLLTNKTNEIVRGESGGRVIFLSYQAAFNFLYPHGYDPCESEYIGHVIDQKRRELLAHIRSLPGAASWGM